MREIAGYLCVAPGTVDRHLALARCRLGATNTTQAVALAIQKGLLDAEERCGGS